MIERVAVHVTRSYDVFRCVTNATRNQKHKPQKQTIIRIPVFPPVSTNCTVANDFSISM